jgi:magnesium transporter
MAKRNHIPRLVPGTAPGTLVAQDGGAPTTIDAIAYGPDTHVIEGSIDAARSRELRGVHSVIWINVVGLSTVDVFTELGDIFGLHRLALEDTFNTAQRPKVDSYRDHHYFVVRVPSTDPTHDTEQLSIFLGNDYVITIQERPGDLFDPIRERIRIGRPRIRQGAAEYLTYALLDVVVDSLFPRLEAIDDRLERIEAQIIENPNRGYARDLHATKRELVRLRRHVTPLRELLVVALRHDHDAFTPSTRLYIRDCMDHATQAVELVESQRDIATGLLDLSLSLMSQHMNEIMKVLTIIATLFIPLSFVCGLYGMNFDPDVSKWNMPELSWTLGYPFALGLMVAIAVGFLSYFRRKGWL